MISIRVFRETGRSPVSNKKVTVATSTGSKTNYTNSSGTADFDLPGGKYKVYVDGRMVHKGACVGVTIVYI